MKKEKVLNVILRNHEGESRLFKVHKGWLGGIIAFSLLAIIALSFYFGAHLTRREYIQKQRAEISQNQHLLRELQLQEKIILIKQKKLEATFAQAASESSSEDSASLFNFNSRHNIFSWVTKPSTFQDRTTENMIRIAALQHRQKDAPELRFNYHSNLGGVKKISGHLFALTFTKKKTIHLYPLESLEGTTVIYNQGESFSFSRLRPFRIPLPPETTLVQLYAFSKKGELIHFHSLNLEK